MRRPITGEVHVRYGQIHVESDPDRVIPGLSDAFVGQRGGLCGARVPGVLWLNTGLHTGTVGFTVEVHDEAPALDATWEDVVEVSFHPVSERSSLELWEGAFAWNLGLAPTDYRVRYCARGMDEARERGQEVAGESVVDSYLLQFWPASPRPDRVIRQTSQTAAHWHRYARGLASPPTSQPRVTDKEHHARQARKRAAEERRLHYERWEWCGRLPSPTLRAASESNVLGLVRFDSDLVHALDAAGPEVQRAVAVLAARRACEAAGLTGLPWVAHALTELAEGRPLPPPFDDPAQMSKTLRSDPRVPATVVVGATLPERPPFRPPMSPDDAGRTRVQVAEFEEDGTGRPGLGRASAPLAPAKYRDKRPAPSADTVHAVEVQATRTTHARGEISQPHFALPAVVAAAESSPLKAALDAVWHALNTFGEHYPELLDEVWSACAERRGKGADRR